MTFVCTNIRAGFFCALRVPGFGPILAWGAWFWAEGEYINDLVWPGVAWCGLVWPGCAGDPLAPIRTNVRMLFLVTHAEQEGRRIYSIYIYIYGIIINTYGYTIYQKYRSSFFS